MNTDTPAALALGPPAQRHSRRTLVAAAGFIVLGWPAGFLGLAPCLLLENLARMWRGETALKNQFV